jgi:16S rRNA (adenine1518-N6/adenine1519-N6)-dimethyltransferase
VLEIGAGLGSLTVALAELDAEVLAVELDRALLPALEEVVAGRSNVRVVSGDAVHMDWAATLDDGPWRMASNLPYNVAVPVVMRLLEEAPSVRDLLVMVQREVGERLAATPRADAYGAVSVKVRYFADAKLLRRIPRSVFWPEPAVESVLLRVTPREPPVSTNRQRLFRVIEEGFAQRRKTMANALVRLGADRTASARMLEACGADARARAESLSLQQFACLTDAIESWSE